MQIYLLLTEMCNLNCKMCIRGDKKNRELTLAELRDLNCLNEFAEHDVVITGGEPSLCKEFISIVSFLKDKCKSISICTNGTIDTYINDEFLDSKVDIQISIDGPQDIHDSIRGKKSFERILKTISKLEMLGLNYTISSVVSRKNASCMKDFADELESLKFMKYWKISYEMPFGHADINEIMTAEEWNVFVDDMLDYVNFRMKIQKMFPFDLFDKNKNKLDELFKERRCSNCGSGNSKIYIYPDLRVYPCTCLTDFCLGSLKENSLSNILRTDLARKFANYSVTMESKCRECEYLRYCNGGCIGMSYHFFKQLGVGDIRCPRLRNQI